MTVGKSIMTASLIVPRMGFLVVGVALVAAVACNTSEGDGPDDGTGGIGGSASGGRANTGGRSGTGGAQTGGDGGLGGGGGSCTAKLYPIDELCESDAFPSRDFDGQIPDDPLNNPDFECTAQRPDIATDEEGRPSVFRYRSGCGLAQWYLADALPPNPAIVWRIEDEELVGCSVGEDYPLPDQCGGFTRYAGERFDCDDYEQKFCVLASMGGAGGAGSD